MTRALAAAASAALLNVTLASANTTIALEDVPENVMETAINTAPGVTFERVSIESENGVSIYEFEATDHAGRHLEIDITEDGELEEIEMEHDFDDIPAAVAATLDKTVPGFEPDYVEFSVRQNAPIYVYEFDGSYEGRPVDIEIAEDGELLLFTHGLSS